MKKTSPKRLARAKEHYRENRVAILAKRRKWLEEKKKLDPVLYKDNRRDILLRHRYNISSVDYFRLLLKQGGACALCEQLATDEKTGVLQVDHDHKTGRIRGLLCRSCNTALGKLGDDPRSLLKVFLYVVKHALD